MRRAAMDCVDEPFILCPAMRPSRGFWRETGPTPGASPAPRTKRTGRAGTGTRPERKERRSKSAVPAEMQKTRTRVTWQGIGIERTAGQRRTGTGTAIGRKTGIETAIKRKTGIHRKIGIVIAIKQNTMTSQKTGTVTTIVQMTVITPKTESVTTEKRKMRARAERRRRTDVEEGVETTSWRGGRRRRRRRRRRTEPENRSGKLQREERGVEDMQNESPLDRVIRNKPADQEYVEALSPARLPRPTSAKGQRQRAQPGAQDGSDGEGGAEIPSAAKQTHEGTQDAAEALRPQTSQSRRIPRPSSARPAPPRVKRQESYTEPVLPERLGSSKLSAAVIVEGAGLSDQEDDEQFVVEESAAPHLDVPRPETEPAVVVQDDGSHGGLVKKILETKKDYERAPLSSALNDQAERQSPLSEARWKECDLLSREMDRLSASVQAVCRSTVPLGRIVNYLQEDVDSMQVELQAWRRENQEYVQALLQEQRVTESTVEPLRAELSQLEQLIRDQRDKICTIKSSILLNEAKIQKMVSVTTSSSHS
ncbi:TRAF3-interacting protein 1 isoform X5 [Scleropages formosus]|uniref:TRAF3-interacting protein 1 isoform X5 n=1 Tax=Scleropages formosus TaxID=113540 RepID=UPI0010FA86E8|nr:TRAF3-interacting protein 1-like isoform X5 [Scleropages formosus]